jgi:hypothetical protein
MSGPRARRRLVVICSIAVVVGSTAGGAYGVWRGSGGGAGSASAGTTVAVTLSPGTPSTRLYPGGQSDVVLTVSNPNTSTVTLSSLGLDTSQGAGGLAVDGGHVGCALSTLSFTRQTNGGAGWSVPAKVAAVNGTLTLTLTNALAMGPDAANACQGASFTVYLAAGL